MNIYYLSYFLLFLLSLTKKFEINSDNYLVKKKIIFFTFLLLFIFIGFRDEIGGDDFRYQLYYESIHLGLENFSTGTEHKQKPLFYFINSFASFFNLGVVFVNCVAAFIFSVSLIIFCIFSGNLFLGLMLAMPILIIVMAMGYVTQSVALAFLMLAYLQFIKNNKIFFLILIFLGATFHPSVTIFTPMILALIVSRNNLKESFLLALIGTTILIIFYDYFYEMVNNYIGSNLVSSGTIFRLALNFMSVVIFSFFIKKEKLQKNYKILMYFYCTLSTVLLMLTPFGIGTTAIDRIGLYLTPIQILIIIKFLNSNYSIDSRRVVSTIFFIIYLVFMFVWFSFSYYSQDWIPYRNIIF